MNNTFTRHLYLSAVSFLFLVTPRVAGAATNCGGDGKGLTNPIAFCNLGDFLIALLGLVAKIAFPVIVLFIVYIGFRFVQHSASGNAEELKKDRDLFFWAIVGALIVIGAQALSFAIQATVGQLTP